MTRERLTGLLVALLVAGVIVWIAQNTYWEESEERTAPTGEAQTNPYYAAQHLADSLGAHTRVRHDLIGLPSRDTVIVVGYWNWIVVPQRQERLRRWVEDGGRLVLTGDELSFKNLTDWLGVRRVAIPKAAKPSTAQSKIEALTNPDGTAAEHYTPCVMNQATRLATSRRTSWRLTDPHGNAQVLRIGVGHGSVTALNYTDAFENESLICADNALLFSAATQLRSGADIEFLTEADGMSLLAVLWKYGAPVITLVLLLIALWLWRSAVRFGPLSTPPDAARRSLAEQIRGTGQFTLRVGGGRALHAASLRALHETAARRVPRFVQQPPEEQVAILTRLTGLNASELRAALAAGSASRSTDLRSSLAVLEAARRNIATQ